MQVRGPAHTCAEVIGWNPVFFRWWGHGLSLPRTTLLVGAFHGNALKPIRLNLLIPEACASLTHPAIVIFEGSLGGEKAATSNNWSWRKQEKAQGWGLCYFSRGLEPLHRISRPPEVWHGGLPVVTPPAPEWGGERTQASSEPAELESWFPSGLARRFSANFLTSLSFFWNMGLTSPAFQDGQKDSVRYHI